MRITAVEAIEVSAELARPFWMSLESYTTATELVVRLTTDDGLVGIGQAHGRPIGKIGELVANAFGPLLLDADPMDHERIWTELFSRTYSRAGSALTGDLDGQPHFGNGVRPQVLAAIAGIDIALWDLKGKSLGLPVYKLLGGSRASVPCYASGGYYGPNGEAYIDGLAREVASYVDQGFRAVKIKVGGLALEEDVARVARVRAEVGPDVDVMLDANMGYDVPAAIGAARAFEPYRIRWFEEPVHWYDPVRGLGRVAASTPIPIASGESELHRWGCRDLILDGGVQVMQFDATRAGGITEWLRVASYASAHGVAMAPHHDPQIHAHLIAAIPNGLIQEVFPNASRDPLWESLLRGKPEIANGVLYLSDRPGFGFEIDPDGLEAFGKRRWQCGTRLAAEA